MITEPRALKRVGCWATPGPRNQVGPGGRSSPRNNPLYLDFCQISLCKPCNIHFLVLEVTNLLTELIVIAAVNLSEMSTEIVYKLSTDHIKYPNHLPCNNNDVCTTAWKQVHDKTLLMIIYGLIQVFRVQIECGDCARCQSVCNQLS